MSRVVSRAKLEDASFKSLRDTYGSWMLPPACALSWCQREKHYVRILANLERESTAAAARIRMVGGAEIIDLYAHRKVCERESA